MGDVGRSTVEEDLRMVGLEALVIEQLRLAKRLYRLTGEFDAFTPRYHIGDGEFEIAYNVEEAIWRGIHTLETLHARNRGLAMSLEKELHLSEPFPVYPFKQHPSRFGFTIQNQRGNYLFTNYHSEYAAKHALNILLRNKTFAWHNRRLIETNDGMTIKGEHLEDLETIMDYEFKGKEAQWIMPEPYLTYYRRLANSEEIPQELKASVVETVAKRHTAPVKSEPRPDGLIDLATLADELGIEPREARQILRKSVEKPAWGWAWPSTAIDSIKKLLRKK